MIVVHGLVNTHSLTCLRALVQDMFSLCPDYPWDDQLISLTVETNQDGWITLSGFLAFWS